MTELKIGDHVEITSENNDKFYGRIFKIPNDGNIDVEVDFSYILNVPIVNVRKEKL